MPETLLHTVSQGCTSCEVISLHTVAFVSLALAANHLAHLCCLYSGTQCSTVCWVQKVLIEHEEDCHGSFPVPDKDAFMFNTAYSYQIRLVSFSVFLNGGI